MLFLFAFLVTLPETLSRYKKKEKSLRMLDPTLHYMLLIGHNSLIAKKTRVKTVKYFLHVPRNHSSITTTKALENYTLTQSIE